MEYTIKGVKLNIDMEDMGFVQKYEKAHKYAEKDLDAVRKAETASEAIKAKCMFTRNFFDCIFGEGTAEKMFGNTWNARETEEAHIEFLGICAEQTDKANERQARLMGGKFLPKNNECAV